MHPRFPARPGSHHRSAGFQTCCIADFQIGSHPNAPLSQEPVKPERWQRAFVRFSTNAILTLLLFFPFAAHALPASVTNVIQVSQLSSQNPDIACAIHLEGTVLWANS